MSLGGSQGGNAVPTTVRTAASHSRLDVLNARISQLEMRLEALQNQADPPTTTPIAKLPAEILSEVFLFVIPEPVLGARDRNGLQHLNLVSRGWREAALSTHRLWSGVRMGPLDTEYDRIVTWLGRSGKLPKTIAFTHPPEYPPCECPNGKPCHPPNPALKRLLTEGPPLSHFTLECYTIKCYRNWAAALASPPGTSPTQLRPWDQLNSFKLTFVQGHQALWDEPADPSQSAFCHLPSAPSLRLELPSMWAAFEDPEDAVSTTIHIPLDTLHNLTTLEIKCEWWGTQILDLLENSPQLESLTLHTNDTSPEDGPTPNARVEALKQNPIVLPNLRNLRLEWLDRADILKYIRAPALRHLGLHWASCVDPLPDRTSATGIFSFIKESGLEGTLYSLHISDLCTMVEYLSLILINLWGLQSLTLERVKVPGAWAMWQGFQVVAKAIGPDDPVLPHFKGRQYLPSLRKLELLEIPDDYRLEWVGIYLRARKDGIPCHVKVSYQPQERHAKRQGELLKAFCLHDKGISRVTIS